MHRRHTRIAALAIALAVLAGGCGPSNERSELDDTINSAVVAAGDGGILDMREVVTLDWDTMYALGGYVTDNAIRVAVGPSWPSGWDERISSDGLGLVVFVRDGSVAAWSIINDSFLPGPAVRFDHLGLGQTCRQRSVSRRILATWLCLRVSGRHRSRGLRVLRSASLFSSSSRSSTAASWRPPS